LVVHESIEGFVDMLPYLLVLPNLSDGKTWVHDVVAKPKAQMNKYIPSITPQITPEVTPQITPETSITPTVTPKVSITPKATPSKTPKGPGTSTPPGGGKRTSSIVKTGDASMDMKIALGASCLSLIVVVSALVYKHKKRA